MASQRFYQRNSLGCEKAIDIHIFDCIYYPVIVSGIFYVLLVVSKPNKVDPLNSRSSNQPEGVNSFEENNKFGTFDLNIISSEQTNFVNEKSTQVDKNIDENSSQFGRINQAYDYNQILKESGQPFDEEEDEVDKSKNTIYFIPSNPEKLSSHQQSIKINNDVEKDVLENILER